MPSKVVVVVEEVLVEVVDAVMEVVVLEEVVVGMSTVLPEQPIKNVARPIIIMLDPSNAISSIFLIKSF